jgi:hypothetical protein
MSRGLDGGSVKHRLDREHRVTAEAPAVTAPEPEQERA